MEKCEKSKKLFIVHWIYDTHEGDYQKRHDHIDSKELFEFENRAALKKHLNWLLEKRNLAWGAIRSIKLITKTLRIDF